MACKHQNAEAVSYLLGCGVSDSKYRDSVIVAKQLRHYWTKKDFSAMLHFSSNNVKIWKFAIPLILSSPVAHRWFYQERDFNRIDIIYRIQRQFNVKILLSDMFHRFYEELAKPPYAASFFYSYVNQEFLDDAIPELTVLR